MDGIVKPVRGRRAPALPTSSRRSATSITTAAYGGPCRSTSRPWRTVYHYFRAWTLDGTLNPLHDSLRDQVRRAEGRAADPTAASHVGARV